MHTPRNKTIWQRRGLRWLIIFAVWTVVALFMTSQGYLRDVRNNRPTDLLKMLFLMELPLCYLWALFTPLLVRLSRRFRIERGRVLRNTLIHVFISILLSVITMVCYSTVSTFLFVAPEKRNFTLTSVLFSVYTFFDYYMLIYWLIVMISHAFDYYSRST